MPANSLYDEYDMVSGSSLNPAAVPVSAMDDPRALSLALELIQHENNFNNIQGFNDPTQYYESEAERANKRSHSQNMTECVAVPSSEHVAEIVGRQGCKIKALRAKTNTYIKTPVRGEEPVFVVTGRKEDVASAKKEILSAADHFSQIRACRKNNLNGSMAPGPPTNVPGQLTISVRVPYRVVGLVVGPKGATIKRIQQQTQTYIVTPSRDKEPVFEVTGLPDSVDAAKKEIESHIAMRTGNVYDDEGQLAAFAATHNIPMETLMNSPDLMNFFRLAHQGAAQSVSGAAGSQHLQSGSSTLNNVGSASLNAMLSTNSSNQGVCSSLNFGVGMNPLSPNFNSVTSSLNNGIVGNLNNVGSTLNNMGSSLNNGIGSGFSNGVSSLNNFGGSIGAGLNNGSIRSMLNEYNLLQNSYFANMNGLGGLNLEMNNLPNGGSSNSSPGSSSGLNGFGSNGSNGFGNVNGFGTSSGFANSNANGFGNRNSGFGNSNANGFGSSNALSAGQLADLTNFDLLGENATSLLNGQHKNNGLDSGLFSSLRNSANNFTNSSTANLPAGYGIDEGLGSLESSMGSSPALEQNTQNIWGNSGITMPGFSLSGRNFTSGDNTPNPRMSPLLAGHSPARRSNSISNMPQLSALSAALNNLSVGPLRSSSTTSPEDTDLATKIGSLASSVCSSVFQPLTTQVKSTITTNACSVAPTSLIDAISIAATSVATATVTTATAEEAIAETIDISSADNGSSRGRVEIKKVCSACKIKEPTVFMVPCGHNQLCSQCSSKLDLGEDNCPECKEKVEAMKIN